MVTERLQMRLSQPAAAAASAAGQRRLGCLPAAAVRPHRRFTCTAISRGSLLPASLLLPIALPALALLQEST